MNRKAFILMAAIAISGLCSCLSSYKVVDSHNAKISLDWDGVYTGIIPSASGSGIDVRLKLNLDQSYELTNKYLNKSASPFTWTGSFKWDDTGNIITFIIADTPNHFKVAENKLIMLDMDGKVITGKLADNYVLKKEL